MNKLIAVLIVTGLTLGCSPSGDQNPQYADLQQPLNLNKQAITVSGISSGGYMAHQYHIAFSDEVTGAALFASGPYGCAKNSLKTALDNCLNNPHKMDLKPLVESLNNAAENRKVSPLTNLRNDRVWIYHGAKDESVSRQVVSSLDDFYQALDVRPELEFGVPSGHGFPTQSFGTKCELTEKPHLNNCSFDGAGAALKYLYGELIPNTDVAGKILSFNQADFLAEGQSNTLANTGYLFAPEKCLQGQQCRLHIAFHGCLQNEEMIGMDFVENAGYNEWAEANNIVILYPQTSASYIPLNPKGCWDWWGYTGAAYQYKNGAQLAHINAIVKKI